MANTNKPWASKAIEIHCDMGEAFGNWTMGFGRREMQMDHVECEKMVVYQIGALKAFLDIEGIPLSHVSEIIADLEYNEDGDCIISRTHEAANLSALRQRLGDALRSGKIACKGKGGQLVDLKLSDAALSLCIHSDTPGATEVAAVVREVVDEFNNEFSQSHGQHASLGQKLNY
ncbi:hypothetical protein K4F52_008103 [Lecanicillium sp. MT-2017a]|nr:hypothetical protein K4F52_008103 [Lecanicillium sp. MT-2017a]